MPYQTNIPSSAQSPGLFPSQGSDNFTRLKAMISANHKFNDSAASDDGYHQNIKMLPLSVPSNDATVGQSFVNSADATNQLWFKDALNRVFQVTPTIPIYAAVNFNGVSAITYRFRHNVNTVTRNSQGLYTIEFSTALPSANYVVSGVAMGTTLPLVLSVAADGTYGNSVTTSQLKITTTSSGSVVDAIAAFVIVCGG